MNSEQEASTAKSPVLADADRDVWVVERNPGSGWRVSAVLTSFEEAEQYEQDLREWHEESNENMPEELHHDLRTRHGGRKSPTKMFEKYPPEEKSPGLPDGHSICQLCGHAVPKDDLRAHVREEHTEAGHE